MIAQGIATNAIATILATMKSHNINHDSKAGSFYRNDDYVRRIELEKLAEERLTRDYIYENAITKMEEQNYIDECNFQMYEEKYIDSMLAMLYHLNKYNYIYDYIYDEADYIATLEMDKQNSIDDDFN